MQELLEQLIDYSKGIWIKRRYIMISTWLVCPIGWYFVASLPDVYESEARVYVDTQSLLRPLLRGLTVETNPQTQIRLMVKTLLSRPNLERISRMTDLDVQANTSEEYEVIINRLKQDLKISTAGRENIYTLSIDHKNPEMAKNIVQSALTVFIENTLGETRNESDSAQKFLNTQIQEYENRLINSEAKLTDFKQKYSDVLPSQTGGYYSQLNNAKESLKSIELELLETTTKLESARAQLSIDQTASDGSNIKTSNSIQTTYDSRIAELEGTLDGLLLRYTNKHPDVVEATRRLELLNKQRKLEIERYIAENKDNGSSINLMNQNPVIQEVQIQINQLMNQQASLQVRANNFKERVKTLENKIHTLPEIEAELIALNRGYEITKRKHDELLNRRETAQLAQQADETTDKIQFRVIDPPRAASAPSGPPRLIYFLAVTIAGIGAGIGISLLMSQLNPIVTSSRHLSKITGLPIFGVVSANENLGLQKWHRKKTILFVMSNLVLFGILVMFISYFIFPDLIQAPLKRIF